MATLISPGVSVTIIDESFYVPGQQTTLPLIFIATADEKVGIDGITPALGTYEHGIIRLVTSLKQSLELYGVPRYLESADGRQHHGDCRNEYGLDALNKYLEIGNRAYVIRANVNLNDDPVALRTLWLGKMQNAADALEEAAAEYIAAYNDANLLANKQTITKDEFKELANEVLGPVFESYSFSKENFTWRFLNDNTIDGAGHIDIVTDTRGGYIQLSDVTGVEDDETTYCASFNVQSTPVDLVFAGEDIQTFGELIDEMNAAFGANATVELIAGRIRVTSALEGVTSSVTLVSQGATTGGCLPLFSSLNLFLYVADPVSGNGTDQLPIYDETITTIVGDYFGLDGMIAYWGSGNSVPSTTYPLWDGSVVIDEFTPEEAAGVLLQAAMDFDGTLEFRELTSLGANDATRRTSIVTAMQAEINNPFNGARGEWMEYNVTLAPGFPECTDELVRLSQNMLEEVFVIGETPFDRPLSGPNSISAWARTPAKVVSYHVAYAYPHGISSNIDGKDILTTAASTLLRVFAYNDREADLWWAPAGTRRGTCPHLTTIGYVSGALGGPTTFVEDFVDNGSRDELYEAPKAINPITFLPGRGILVLGQKTTSPNASALDRINVSRLVKFIKRELRKAMFSYLFEPNDQITRDQVKFTGDNFLASLISRRGLYDFGSICDESNNTPDRIDRNELWYDVAIKPVKAVEFIYIPVRVVNTGAVIAGTRAA